eukprot:SAG25_NODE_10096_length_346_cov_0.623482_2_plen_24_part_01
MINQALQRDLQRALMVVLVSSSHN